MFTLHITKGIHWKTDLYFSIDGYVTPYVLCYEWGVDIDKITEQEFNYLLSTDDFRRAIWIAARRDT